MIKTRFVAEILYGNFFYLPAFKACEQPAKVSLSGTYVKSKKESVYLVNLHAVMHIPYVHFQLAILYSDKWIN